LPLLRQAQVDAAGGFDGAGDVKPADLLRPDPAHQIRWLAVCPPLQPIW